MQLERVGREQLERVAHEQYVALLGGSRKPAQGRRVQIVNRDEMRALDRPTFRMYRGRAYVVNPISYTDGLDLQAIIARVGSAVMSGDAAAIRAEYAQAVEMFARLMIPAMWWRRWFRRVLPNPFRTISEREVDDLLNFFWKCRTGESFLTSVRRQVETSSLT